MSGGYLEWTLRYAVRTMYNINLSSHDVQQGLNGVTIIPGKNLDFTSVNYTPPGVSSPTLKFAYAYGFRNIQNLVRKLKQKRGPLPYHFVEVMACPSGCINGGGQAKSEDDDKVSKHWIEAASAVYSTPGVSIDPDSNSNLVEIYNDWIGVDQNRERQMLHTSFKAVENLNESGLAVKW
jgi:Iron only hydrogenase large subunit, C-terminal domain